jgi:hypothetical protein
LFHIIPISHSFTFRHRGALYCQGPFCLSHLNFRLRPYLLPCGCITIGCPCPRLSLHKLRVSLVGFLPPSPRFYRDFPQL